MARKLVFFFGVLFVIGIVISGCSASQNEASRISVTKFPTATSTARVLPDPQVVRLTQTSSPAATETQFAPTITPSFTNTPDPFEPWTIDHLVARQYGGGELRVLSIYAENSLFTRYLIEYPSDNLMIAGFMNVPKGSGPFPVIIAIHGYIEPDIYTTLDYTTRYADDLARNGFIVLHPNLRNYPPSNSGENLFRVGMAIDILNLIEIVKQQANSDGYLNQADIRSIGLWGHSMGGGISTRVMTVSDDVKAVFLYAPMSGDERQNFEAINRWSNGERGLDELAVPEAELERISPQNFFDRISAAVSIHHGLKDELVPVEWSRITCNLLNKFDKPVECVFYPEMSHTFTGEGDLLLMNAAVEFFKQHLSEYRQP